MSLCPFYLPSVPECGYILPSSLPLIWLTMEIPFTPHSYFKVFGTFSLCICHLNENMRVLDVKCDFVTTYKANNLKYETLIGAYPHSR